MPMPRRIKITLETAVILVLCSIPIFYRLDTLAIRQWDEARNAVSAMEMLQNRNYIVRYYNGQPDSWDVKPPMFIWFQATSIKLLGATELAVRMPSALAAMFTAFFLIWYFQHYHNRRSIGYLASLILVTSQGFTDRHLARNGDHDALLVLFVTMIIFLYFEFLRNRHHSNRLLVIIWILITASVFTKSVAGLMVLPGLAIITFVYGLQHLVLKNKWFYIGMFAWIMICGSYYLLREHMQPGYLKGVWTGELIPRYLNTNKEFNNDPEWFYIRNLIHERLTWWIMFLLPATITLLWQSRNEKHSISVFIMVNILTFLIIISAGSKNVWYDAPLFPLFAALLAMFFVFCFDQIKRIMQNKWLYFFCCSLLLTGLFLPPELKTLRKVKQTREYSWDEEIYSMAYILRNLQKYPSLSGLSLTICFEGYTGHLLFYAEAIRAASGQSILFKLPEELQTGDVVVMSQESIMKKVNARYANSLILQEQRNKVVKITGSPISSPQ
jgi:4-amino-4-deoxy-L-arabinose transferase-like glycosyltransferase